MIKLRFLRHLVDQLVMVIKLGGMESRGVTGRVIFNPPSLYRKAYLNLQAPLDTELYVTESFYQLIMFSEAPK